MRRLRRPQGNATLDNGWQSREKLSLRLSETLSSLPCCRLPQHRPDAAPGVSLGAHSRAQLKTVCGTLPRVGRRARLLRRRRLFRVSHARRHAPPPSQDQWQVKRPRGAAGRGPQPSAPRPRRGARTQVSLRRSWRRATGPQSPLLPPLPGSRRPLLPAGPLEEAKVFPHRPRRSAGAPRRPPARARWRSGAWRTCLACSTSTMQQTLGCSWMRCPPHGTCSLARARWTWGAARRGTGPGSLSRACDASLAPAASRARLPAPHPCRARATELDHPSSRPPWPARVPNT